MTIEVAILNVTPGEEKQFENAMKEALPLISSTPGFESIALHPCVETSGRYLLLVHWRRIEDHTVGFRQSDRYDKWRKMLHHFYKPFPVVEHYSDSVL